ncbi:MAG: ABC-F family ATP-binding cassette domain-containing protein [Clostridia bacterium]|nr:ABC-F family ATP-binding cassette domain-containing protein [Clostridia bacterium]
MLISIDGLSKNFGERRILDNVSLTIEEKGRYGLIGVNGAGKSTLLDVILGNLEYEVGNIYKSDNTVIGFLKQNSGLERDCSIIEEMQKAFSDVISAQERMVSLGEKMGEIADKESSEYKATAGEYSKCQALIDSRDGYNIDVKIATILNGMGFGNKDTNTIINTLSGGEKTRLAIAKLLLEEPNLLILDEPTNHLDFKTLNWLEEYLISYKGAVLVVSHDRYFLDKIVDTVFEIERGKIYTYKGNYSKFLKLKEERRERQQKEYEAQQEEIAKMQTYIDKNLARASTSNSAKSRIKALESMELIEKPDSDLKVMKLKFETVREPYKDVLKVNDLEVCVGEEKKVLCSNINLHIRKGEKIAIIGDNGIGKSSFLKTILDIIPHYNGSFEWGKNVSLSYYEQENLNINQDKIAIDELWDRFPHISETDIRKVLGSVLLTKDDVYKPVKVISGGERAKLAFCIIMLEKANVIILDEPTNHLDLASKEVLEKALSEYEGTLIFVSHDRYLLNKVPDKIVEIEAGGVFICDGGYEDYKARKEFLASKNEAPVIEKIANKPKSSYRSKEQRRQDATRKNRIKELEILIEKTEELIRNLEEEMTKEEVFSDYELMNEKCEALSREKESLESYYEEWTMLSDEAEG